MMGFKGVQANSRVRINGHNLNSTQPIQPIQLLGYKILLDHIRHLLRGTSLSSNQTLESEPAELGKQV